MAKGDKVNLRDKFPKRKKDDAREEIELPRDAELMDEEDVRDTLGDLYDDIQNALDKHSQRIDNNADNWDMFNCKLGPYQFYSGNSQIYVPLVRDAVEARKTRFTNQLFPRSGRYADCISQDATRPSALMSLLDFYVRKCRLKTQVVPALIKHGDLEGQYSIYVSWQKNERHVCSKRTQQGPLPEMTIETIHEETVEHAYPHVEVLSDADLLVVPTASQSLEHALNQGGAVVVIRRWTKAKIRSMVAAGELDKDAADQILEELTTNQENPQRKDPVQQHLMAAGIKTDGRKRYALVYEIWAKLLIKDERRLCVAYMWGQNRILSCRRNPYWSDKLPILSVPKDKVANAVKGRAPVDCVRDFQIGANDAVNMGMDSAQYALSPIVMTDPEKNPKIGSMILTMAAVWPTSPKDTQILQFPPLWKDALEIVASNKAQIFQSLGVNPAMVPSINTSKAKPNQAQVAMEQQVDLLTTADAVSVLEEGILTPMLQRFIELDHQFRDETLTVPMFGEMGEEARMQHIEPIQFDRHYSFRWYGVEAARNAQQIQQQVSFLNVIMRLPPQTYQGYKLNLVPAITYAIESIFGPNLAPLIFQDVRQQLGTDPMKENTQMLAHGILAQVHPMDNHEQHIQAHAQLIQQTGDPSGVARAHVKVHEQAIMMQMMAQQQPQGPQGGPPGQGGPQGMRPGAGGPQAGGNRPMQQPAGALHKDQMQPGAGGLPRKIG